MNETSVLESILDLARWAPSGDNVQSWQFEIAGPQHVIVHAADTRHDCVYDLDGHPSQIAFGALLETMAIAASTHGLRAHAVRRELGPAEVARPVFDVHFAPDPGLAPDPLAASIKVRSVQRRPMHTRPLSAAEKKALKAAVEPAFSLTWLETFSERYQAARLMYNNAKLRLTMPEAYEVHKRIIDWGKKVSPDRVPDQALGVDPGTIMLMKWAMASWRRLSLVNRLMGTWAPRLQMDFVPGLACAAHFVLKAKQQPGGIDDYVAAGRAVQRFWLTLTDLGLVMQPEMTPLIFSKYVREKRPFTGSARLHGLAAQLEQQTARLVFKGDGFPVYMGRLGAGPVAAARSERKPLADLLIKR
jgi:hypothetical protein